MATAPAYAATPRHAVGALSAANTNRDGTGTVVTVFTAGASGSRIDKVRVAAKGNTTAGVVRLFIYDGTNYALWDEFLVTAITPSTAVSVFETEEEFTYPILLPAGYSLRASTHNAETFSVFAIGGDF
jgi:hypothetical protein